jgi:hypothetical protein
MGDLNLNTIKKQQVHSENLRAWTYRGTHVFNDFAPIKILAGDNWVCMSESAVNHNDLILYPGDMVIALVDNPGALEQSSLDDESWKILRNSGSVGGKLIIERVFYITESNYDIATHRLTVPDLPVGFFKASDNVNVKVNSASYTSEAFAIVPDSQELLWKPNPLDAGFDLENGDLIEVEVFRT